MTANEVFTMGRIEGKHIYVSDAVYQIIQSEHPETHGDLQIWYHESIRLPNTSTVDQTRVYVLKPDSFMTIAPWLWLPEGL